ncbi:MAG TPA: ABC transporter permease [Bryobacteraceae bacterium]|nr:ABC transporter permease [Bryobacteraceae bacterium]
MLLNSDTVSQSFASLKAHKLRTVLTVVGLMMGVATLITVMTIVQGANVYVEKKIANLGTNVFQLARTPFAATDFNVVIKALKNKHIEIEDLKAVQELCVACKAVGASGNTTAKVRYLDNELADVNIYGHTPNMVDIDTRTLILGRYFTDSENDRSAQVCLVGDSVIQSFFPGTDPLGKVIRIANEEYTVIGTFEKMGSVLGQDQDNLVIIPMNQFFRLRPRFSLTLNILTEPGKGNFERAQEEATVVLRARRHVGPGKDSDFFIGTKDSYIALWQSISGAFFAVFLMVSSISAVVGGIVIMNVMLVSVTERTKEIGVRRALGATKGDIAKQFLTESVMQCLIGGFVGISAGFLIATLISTFTAFPAAVQTWVAILGLILSSVIGLFFGIYPAMRASKLDPVVALRAE